MKKYCIDLKVNSVERLSEKHVLLRLSSPDGLPEMLPGQFVEVRVDDSPSTFLRRPISINNVDEEAGELWLLVATIGDGTRRLGRLSGQRFSCLNCITAFCPCQQPNLNFLRFVQPAHFAAHSGGKVRTKRFPRTGA